MLFIDYQEELNKVIVKTSAQCGELMMFMINLKEQQCFQNLI